MRETSRFRDGARVAVPAVHAQVDPRKLELRPQTIRLLTDEALSRVAGGFIMKDTIIIRTGGVVPEPEPAPTVRDR